MKKELGKYSLVAGLVIAIVLGLFSTQLGSSTVWLWSLIVILGLVAGFINITPKNTKEFLWFAVALVIIAYTASAQIETWQRVELIGTYLSGIFHSLLAFIVPMSVIVALKSAWELAKGTE